MKLPSPLHMLPPEGALSTFGTLAALLLLSSLCQQAAAQVAPTRGELLYATHCIACHSSQMHWRDEKAATDWARLKAQVRRWQARANLGWSEADIVEVARHLNDKFYGFAQTSDLLSLVSGTR